MYNFLKSKKFYIVVFIILVVVVGGFAIAKGRRRPLNSAVKVARADLVQEVSVTGVVKPTESLELAFETAGKVAKAPVQTGSKVTAGQILAELETGDLSAQFSSALAAVESAKAQQLQYQAALEAQAAKLQELRRGARPEEIAVKQAELNESQRDLENYYDDIADTLSDAYTKADDAVRVKISALFSGSATTAYTLTYTTADYQAGLDAANWRYEVEKSLLAWQAKLQNLPPATVHAELEQALADGKIRLAAVKRLLERVSDTLQTSTNLTSTTQDTYRSNVNTARTNVVTALTSVSALEQNLSAQKVTVDKTQNELALLLVGTDPQQIAAQEAVVRQAEANIASQAALVKQYQANAESAMAKLARAVIRSPIEGMVTRQDAKVGQIVAANQSLVGVISNGAYEIEANVPEVDVAKVEVGQEAKVTLDAYGNEVIFPVTVVFVEPAETVIEGVIYYKVKLLFKQEDRRLKSGMTANVDIVTDSRALVLIVPHRAVIQDGDKKFVRVLSESDARNYEKREVQTGLGGAGGMVEVVSGLREGEQVLTSTK